MGHYFSLSFIYCLLVFTISPIVALAINNVVGSRKVLATVKILLPLFLFANLLSYLGYSFKGDYAGYVLVSLESFCGWLLLFSINIIKKTWLKVLRAIGYTAMVVSLLIGFTGIGAFMSWGWIREADQQYHISKADKNYAIRRYNFSFVDALYITYFFEVYSESGSFKHHLCSFRLDDDYYADHWNFESGLQLRILDTQNCRFLIVTDTAGHRCSQLLK